MPTFLLNATEDITRRVQAIPSDTEGAVGAIGGSVRSSDINYLQTTIASAIEEHTTTTAAMNRRVTATVRGASGIAGSIAGLADALQAPTAGVA